MKRLLIAGMMMTGIMGCVRGGTGQVTGLVAGILGALAGTSSDSSSYAEADRQRRQAEQAQAYQDFQAFHQNQVNQAAQALQPPINCVIKPPVTTSDGHRVAGAMGTNYTARCQ